MLSRLSFGILAVALLGVYAHAENYSSEAYRDGSCSLHKALNCDVRALCIENPEQTRFRCYCPYGTEGDGYNTDLGGTGCDVGYIECRESKECSQFGTCNNTNGNSGSCVCNPGFVGNGALDGGCTDVDECQEHPCDIHADCSNLPGSYSCACRLSENYDGDGHTCAWKCFQDSDCHPQATCNTDSICQCEKGFSGDGRVCDDIDECAADEDICKDHSVCVNLNGTFRCDCHPGYRHTNLNCTPYPRTCDEIYQNSTDMTSGTYTIDVDFNGPIAPIEVFCDVRNGFAITEIRPQGSYPATIPTSASTTPVDYVTSPENIIPLVKNSNFCSQLLWLECTSQFKGGMVQWKGADRIVRKTWGGATHDGMCPCGEMKQCADGCKCGKGGSGVDSGYVIDKSQLPVAYVIFPKSSQNAGSYMVGPIRCAPHTFDIPKDCHEAKFKNNLKTNTAMLIDIDGDGPKAPFLVFCDVQRFPHVGITQIPIGSLLASPQISSTGSKGVPVDYPTAGPNVEDVIQGSVYCSQSVEYQCQSSTMDAAGVEITSRSGRLDYFPGGNGQQGSCGCGITNSCESKTVKCNCQIGDGKARKDIGLIIDKNDLPILKVTSTVSDGIFVLGPLECSQKQFGIEPNCEKYRLAGQTFNYSYLIDPDGPSGSKVPFTAQCEFNDLLATTIINNDKDGGIQLSGEVFHINYLQASQPQIEGLKTRSTYCTQDVIVKCSENVNTGRIKFTAGTSNVQTSLATILSTCADGTCDCTTGGISDEGTAINMTSLPLYSIITYAASGTVEIGPLKCKEIFPDCQRYQTFVKQQGVEGELKLVTNVLTIDPDGPKNGEPFSVQCNDIDTIIDKPLPNVKSIRVVPGKPGKTECFNLTYTDKGGRAISNAQLAVMMNKSSNCRQSLTISCNAAPITKKVFYTTCDGRRLDALAGSGSTSTCACGVSGVCSGGSSAQCNCDSGTVADQQDVNLILENSRLPICGICMEVDPIPVSTNPSIPARTLKYEVSQLNCGKKEGRRGNCQTYRQESTFTGLKDPVLKDMWYDAKTQPFIVGCSFKPYPPIGELVIRPLVYTYEIPVDSPLNVTIVYRTVELTVLREAMNSAKYCTQRIYLFCAAQLPVFTQPYGFYSNGKRVVTQIRDLTEAERSEACTDSRFSNLCTLACGAPVGVVVTDTSLLPITDVVLPRKSGVTVGVADATCAYVEKDCDAILKSGKSLAVVKENSTYVIDPDQVGPYKPFTVGCDFLNNQGLTKVPVFNTWKNGSIGGSGANAPVSFRFSNIYPTATPEQIHSLVQNSGFCWMGVKYECKEAALLNGNQDPESYLILYNGQSSNFGTASRTEAAGCACGVLGTCTSAAYTCNCDAKGPMTSDQGFITDRDSLPVTGFVNAYSSPGGRGALKTTDVRCGPSPVDIPRDCAEAADWKTKNGITYGQNGEILISPDSSKVEPFLVYCDYTTSPGIPITRVHPKPVDRKPTDNTTITDIPYQGPTDEQLNALITISAYCYQPVRVDCFQSSLLSGGTTFTGARGTTQSFWSTGQGNTSTCTCGSERLCGGTESRRQQEATKCNCDLGDQVWRRDAAILSVKAGLPVRRFIRQEVRRGHLNLTVGDLFCAQQPIKFNECALGFHDCAPEANCLNTDEGYKCSCPIGWQGKVSSKPLDAPVANGRQCIDDDECSQRPCPYSADCRNTPGSFECVCRQGYRNSGPRTCQDINECLERTHNCDVNARCVNNIGSFRCFCKKGFRGNGTEGNCYPVGQCTCFGDPHCVSFDGTWNHFQGKCSYIMAKSNCRGPSGFPEFQITTTNWDRNFKGVGQYAWVKDVTVELYGYKIALNQGKIIMVDGVKKSAFQLLSSDKLTVKLGVAVVEPKVELRTDFGLEVTWDGDNEVQVVTPDTLKGHMCGLCGNYNQNATDDWTVGPRCPALAGTVTSREELFGNSWSLDSATCPMNCNPKVPVSTCNSPMDYVRDRCRKLMSNSTSVFRECLEAMDMVMLEGMRVSCEYDLCYTNNLTATLCALSQAMATMCEDIFHGSSFKNQSSEFCLREYQSDLCVGVTCREPNTVCRNGSCVCKMGYTANCQTCEDFDECATGNHSCIHLGQKCVNLQGTYECTCMEGFNESDGYCHDINECELAETNCGPHSECSNRLGGYECVCCMGYSKLNETCQRDESLDEVYGAPGQECCACTGKSCTNPEPICATDGNTYANYATMVVTGCRKNTTLEVNYKNSCQDSCDNVVCSKPFQECSQSGPDGAAICTCPDCSGGKSQSNSPVCGSNKKIYSSACVFKQVMCETDRSDVTMESSMEPCGDGPGSMMDQRDEKCPVPFNVPVGPWGPWSECSPQCGVGKTIRARSKIGNTNFELKQEAVCYTVCKDGPCYNDSCPNPGQVCIVEGGNAVCVCPDCTGRPEEPVCSLVGNVVKTFENECKMKQYACELTKNFAVLENRTCEEKPSKCGRIRNFAVLRDKNGCETLGSVDIGFCSGGCGADPGLCCRSESSTATKAKLNYHCPNSANDYTKEVPVVNSCACVKV